MRQLGNPIRVHTPTVNLPPDSKVKPNLDNARICLRVQADSALREGGVRVGVDDAGAGYASFSYVPHLQPDIIKLDRSLVARVYGDRGRHAFVAAIVGLGSAVGATLTDDGVETVAELRTLANAGLLENDTHPQAHPNPQIRSARAHARSNPGVELPASPLA